MYLPDSALYCIRKLESAGFSAYVVGGCVRDALLGLTPQDYDLCTDARPEDTCLVFADHTLVRSGQKHGTIGVVVDSQVYEITTFRTEGTYTDSRHPDRVDFVSSVTQDLARRDFTVNAMAYNPATGLEDPWDGREDLKNRVLRTVGEPQTRFREDALRILRGVRFAVRYNLQPEQNTYQAMLQMAPSMDNLARERVFDELCKLLPIVKARDLLTFAPIVIQAVPALAPTLGFLQHNRHHAYDVFTHTAHVVENCPSDLSLRWAALLHDTGKPQTLTIDEDGQGHFLGHAQISAQLAEETLRQLKAPTALRQQVVLLIEQHMTRLLPDKKILRRWLGRLGEETLRNLLALQQADMGSKGTGIPKEAEQFPALDALLGEITAEEACLSIKDLAVNGNDLMEAGFAPGPELGKKLQWLLEQVLDERLPNKKQALLQACKEEQL